jgi:putative AdoMet-dependent methyltransferase
MISRDTGSSRSFHSVLISCVKGRETAARLVYNDAESRDSVFCVVGQCSDRTMNRRWAEPKGGGCHAIYKWASCCDYIQRSTTLWKGKRELTRSIEETTKLFDTWASTYSRDLENANGILEGYETSIETASQVCPVTQGMHVLDIGIGTGNFAQRLEAKGAVVSGIDLSEAMVAECQKLHPNYELRTGTFQSIPFAESAFDVIVSSFCFHEVPAGQRLEACREVYRVLREGGHLCLLDIIFASKSAMAEARSHMLSHWDESEEYSLVGDLSDSLYTAKFTSVRWVQTGRLHWMCLAYK